MRGGGGGGGGTGSGFAGGFTVRRLRTDGGLIRLMTFSQIGRAHV